MRRPCERRERRLGDSLEVESGGRDDDMRKVEAQHEERGRERQRVTTNR